MPKQGGTITRRDIIEDDALHFGKEYADNVKMAIEANDKLVDSAKALNKVSNDYRKATNQNEFLKAKQQEVIALTEVKNAIIAEEEALKSAERIKQETLKTRNAELAVLSKEESLKKRTTTLSVEERIQNEANNRALREAAKSKLNLTVAYDKLNKQRTEAKNKLKELIATEGASIESIKKAKKEFDELAAKVKRADDAVDDFTKNVGNYPNLNKFAGSLKEIVGAFGLTAGIAGAVTAFQDAYKTIKEFDQGIADLQAITGATGKDLDFLRKNAIELGKDTKGGAIQVVEAYKLIASAKPELLENVEALNMVTKSVLTLSKASGMELPESATALTDAMNQFNAPAEEAARYIDAVANGAKYGAAEIPQVTEALLKFGSVAASSNISIEESTALIELLAEKGLKGAEAGTALRNVLLKISAPDALPKDAQKIIGELGISMTKLKDNTIPVQEKMEMLKPLLKDNAYLVKVFGVENTVAARNILGNTERLKELTSKMGEYGTAQEQADIRMNTLQGRTEKLSSTYDSFILSLNEGRGFLSGFLSELAETFTFALDSLIRLNTSWEELYQKAKQLGKEDGAVQFERTIRSLRNNGVGDLEALTSTLGQARLDFLKFDKELKEAQKASADFNPYAINISGPSGKELKLEVERLLAARAKQAEIIKQSNTKIAILNNEQAGNEKKKNDTIKKLTVDDAKEREKAAREAERLRKEQLAKLKKIDDDAFALWKFRKEQEIKIADEITGSDKEEIQNRIDALVLGNKKEEDLAEATAKYKLRQLSRYNDEVRDLSDVEIDNIVSGLDKKTELTNAEILVLEEYRAKKRDIGLKELDDTQNLIDKIIDQEKKKADALARTNTNVENEKITTSNVDFKSNSDALKSDLDAGLITQSEYLQKLEDLQLDHEEEILKIKKEYAVKGLKEQISAFEQFLKVQDTLPEKERISAEKRKEIEATLIEAKKTLSEKELENTDLTTQQKIEKERAYTQRVLELTTEFTSAISGLTNQIFSNKIASIDAEMQKWDEYYSEQIRLAGDDQRQKDLLEADAKKKRDDLEKQKKKEQIKQAIFNKASAALNIGLSTAMAIMQSYAQMGPIAGNAGAILAGVMGAIQLATVLAAPIPKYEKGTQGKPHGGGAAWVGEVRPEVVLEPGKNPYVISSPTLLNLAKGTEVVPSLSEYQRISNKENMDSLITKGLDNKSEFEKLIFLNFNDKEMLKEMKLTRKLLEKNGGKTTINLPKGQDIPHSIWAYNNTKWS